MKILTTGPIPECATEKYKKDCEKEKKETEKDCKDNKNSGELISMMRCLSWETVQTKH